MKKNIKTIQIAFNLNDPWQNKLYNYLVEKGEPNISSYGKLLIKKDMMGEWEISQDESVGTIDVDASSFL